MEKQKIRKILLIILSTMILWDFSLHLQELIGIANYLIFPTKQIYTYFWTIYWGIAFIISIIIIKLNNLEGKC